MSPPQTSWVFHLFQGVEDFCCSSNSALVCHHHKPPGFFIYFNFNATNLTHLSPKKLMSGLQSSDRPIEFTFFVITNFNTMHVSLKYSEHMDNVILLCEGEKI